MPVPARIEHNSLHAIFPQLLMIIVSILHVIVNILEMSFNNEKYFTLVNTLPASGDFYKSLNFDFSKYSPIRNKFGTH